MPHIALRFVGGAIGLVLVGGTLAIWTLWPHQVPNLPSPPLKDLAAKHNIILGNFAIPSHFNDKPYTQILTSQFNLALVDNQPNWHFTDGDLRPTETTFDFSRVDQVMQFAQNNNMQAELHHFVWGDEKWLPDWLLHGNYTKQQLLDILRNHITTVGQRYAGKARHWSVVNEAFTRRAHKFGLHDWWADHVGDQSYIDQSFIWARQADPHAKLVLNDFGNETQNEVSNAMYTYIKDARARGVPIDAIGMQMHIDGTHPPLKDDIIANMRRFADLGVEVYVTEFDINMNDVKASASDKNKIQGDIYYDVMRACIESKVCRSFSILGITDAETWYNYLGLPDARPLPFDKSYNPKPAFFRLRQALEEN